tara:strand:+ start:16173 stop:16970 length:798 start_codon:yes stop_codon:yes gene_type:complete
MAISWKQIVTTDDIGYLTADANTVFVNYNNFTAKPNGSFLAANTNATLEANGCSSYYIVRGGYQQVHRQPVTQSGGSSYYLPAYTSETLSSSIKNPFSEQASWKISKVWSTLSFNASTYNSPSFIGQSMIPINLDFGVIDTSSQSFTSTLQNVLESPGMNGASERLTNLATDKTFTFIKTHPNGETPNQDLGVKIWDPIGLDDGINDESSPRRVQSSKELQDWSDFSLSPNQAILPVIYRNSGSITWNYNFTFDLSLTIALSRVI